MRSARSTKFCFIPVILLSTNWAVSQPSDKNVHAIPVPPPITTKSGITVPKSPVAKLRQLLAMNRQEQEEFLADKSEAEKLEIIAKIEEYKALPPDERELKLKATELRWYLRSFITTPQTNRSALLASVPSRDRKLVQDRLRYWDTLPPQARRQLQTNQAVDIYFSLPVEQRIFAWATNSEPVQEAIRNLQSMPEDQRQKSLESFHRFFSFTSVDKEKIMETVIESERQQMRKVLAQFESLPVSQREVCIQSFEKFKNMSPEQQQQFLKNAELWNKLTPEERQQWKGLVEDFNRMPPAPSQDFPGQPRQ
jgi:hypothetical protein